MFWWTVGAVWVIGAWVLILAMCKAAKAGDMPAPPQDDDLPGVVVALDAYREKEAMQ